MVDKIKPDYNKQNEYTVLLFIIFLIFLNPLAINFTKSARISPPDTFAYYYMAKQLFITGQMFIPSWGQINSALILPPLYPFLIASAEAIIGEGLAVAEYISAICAIVAIVPLFFIIREYTNNVFSFVSSLLIQVNFFYYLMGMSPLTESIFLLLLSLILLMTVRFFKYWQNFTWGHSSLLGFLVGLLFLSRQIGIIYIPFFLVLTTVYFLFGFLKPKQILRNTLYLLIGFILVIIPYSAILYSQTGQHIFQQRFHRNTYTAENNRLDSSTLKEIKRINSIPNTSYINVYAKRRLMRKLTADGSEMLRSVQITEKESIIKKIIGKILNPLELGNSLLNNLRYMAATVGNGVLTLFFITIFTPVFIRNHKKDICWRYVLPFFLLFYWLVISLISGLIDRYIYVVFPFIIAHLLGESFICYQLLIGKYSKKKFYFALLSLTIITLFLTTPKYFYELNTLPKINENYFSIFQKELKGSPVFSLHPVSVLFGGLFRIMPNDTLEKVVKYAHNTGVNWLMVDRTRDMKYESRFYIHAKWYWEADLKENYNELIQFCCSTPDGLISLYRIKSPEP